MTEDRRFHIIDIDCTILVEITTRKELLSYLEEYTENFEYDWFDGSDTQFTLLYKDGSYDVVNEEYDGHKIKKQNILSIVYDNPETSMVYGNFEINEYGVVTVAEGETMISEENIIEVA